MWILCGLCLVVYFTVSDCGQNDVRMPPSILKGPETEVIFRDNRQVILRCRAEGTPAVTYVWKNNGVYLNLNQPTISRGSDGDITIVNATRKDASFYQCFATNQYGTALSTVAHIQHAFLDRTSQSNIVNMTVQEGRPFVIQAPQHRSFPTPSYNWEITPSAGSRNPWPFWQSRRVRSARNGDLHFSYALQQEDELAGNIFKSTAYNVVTFETSNASYTRVMVTQGSRDPPDFPPNITYFSKSQEVALIGGEIELECFFSGKPLPEITWSGPRNNLPSERNSFSSYKAHLTISYINKSDEGDYACTANNTLGRIQHTHNIRVEAKPDFERESDSPCNVNVTEGNSATFNCSAFAIPEATVVWLRNGEPIDVNQTPQKFVFSNDLKSLTIRDVCRDCVNEDRETDLMVIQCNASNVHGYAFASGYLNVLLKTKVTIRGPQKVSVDFLEEKHFLFQCIATSDPSTAPTVRWYKTEPFGDLVRDEPPYVFVAKVSLIILFYPNCSSECSKYLGEYRCIGDNGYSRDNQTITLSYQYRLPPAPHTCEGATHSFPWWVLLVSTLSFGALLLLVGLGVGLRCKQLNKYRVDTSRDPTEYPITSDSLKEKARDDDITLQLVGSSVSQSIANTYVL